RPTHSDIVDVKMARERNRWLIAAVPHLAQMLQKN
ncbi:MAG: hypothetical protein ACI9UA_003635, partial [Pseudoalteromonas tetraodonis]